DVLLATNIAARIHLPIRTPQRDVLVTSNDFDVVNAKGQRWHRPPPSQRRADTTPDLDLAIAAQTGRVVRGYVDVSPMNIRRQLRFRSLPRLCIPKHHETAIRTQQDTLEGL